MEPEESTARGGTAVDTRKDQAPKQSFATKDLEEQVRRLIDHEEIRQAMYSYARGVDRNDADLLRAAYHSDAWDDHGNFQGGPEDVVKTIRSHAAEIPSSMHHIGNILIDLAGDVANVESYFVSYHQRNLEGKAFTRTRAGRYIDRFERRGGQWRIARRMVIDDWSRLDEVVATAVEVGRSNKVGTRNRSDASYQLSQFAQHG